MTIYPSGIDTIVQLPLVANNTVINPDIINNIRNGVVAVETELGIKPSGIHATVRDRLDTLETLVSALTGGTLTSPLPVTGPDHTHTRTLYALDDGYLPGPSGGEQLVVGSDFAFTTSRTFDFVTIFATTGIDFTTDPSGNATMSFNANGVLIENNKYLGFSAVGGGDQSQSGIIRLPNVFSIRNRAHSGSTDLGVLETNWSLGNGNYLQLGSLASGALNTNTFDSIFVSANTELDWSIFNGAAFLLINNSGHIAFGSSSPTTLAANLGFLTNGQSDSLALYGDGYGVFYRANAQTVPTTNPSGGIIEYVETDILKYRKSDGTIIVLNGITNLTTQVTGILPVANGGTGLGTFTDGILHVTSNVISSSQIVNSDISVSAAIDPKKIATAPSVNVTADLPNIDWSKGTNLYAQLPLGATALTFSNVTDGQTLVLELISNAGGSTVTQPVGVKWPGGTAPTQTSTGKDVYTYTTFNSIIFGSSLQNFS